MSPLTCEYWWHLAADTSTIKWSWLLPSIGCHTNIAFQGSWHMSSEFSPTGCFLPFARTLLRASLQLPFPRPLPLLLPFPKPLHLLLPFQGFCLPISCWLGLSQGLGLCLCLARQEAHGFLQGVLCHQTLPWPVGPATWVVCGFLCLLGRVWAGVESHWHP